MCVKVTSVHASATASHEDEEFSWCGETSILGGLTKSEGCFRLLRLIIEQVCLRLHRR